MKILLITARFYPQNLVSVLRVGQWAKYWALDGHDVTVLTSKKYSFMGPFDFNYQLPKQVRVIETKFKYSFCFKEVAPNTNIATDKQKKNTQVKFLKEKTRFLRHSIGHFLEINRLWIHSAKKTGKTLIESEKFDLIISSYGPSTSHIIAKNLKKLSPESIWVADFRDLWAENHAFSPKGILKKINANLEEATIKEADIITTVSEPWTEIMKKKYPKKPIYTIENGFDPDEFPNWEKNLENGSTCIQKTINITYTGSIYKGKQNPTPLFDAIIELIQEEKITQDQIKVTFYGNNKSEVTTIIKKNVNYPKIIHIGGMLSRDEILKIQQKSDLLLFLDWTDINTKGVIPAKLFEYLASSRPILAIGIDKDSSAAHLIKGSGTGIFSLKKETIKETLLSILKNKAVNFYTPNIEAIDHYSRKKQAQKVLFHAKNHPNLKC